jgi:UDP-glucose 4-epimerase
VKLPISETDPTLVLSNYAATKLLGENFALMYSRNYDIPTAVVRYSNVYGYGQSPKNPYCGVLGKFIHNALVGDQLTIFGDGEQTRDYTFVDDAVNATILSAVHPRAFGDVFNVGTSIETSVNQLVKIISDQVPNVDVATVPERDIDNIRRRSIDITKIHNNLGWSPHVNIKEGIRRTLEWYKNEML